MAGKRKSFLTPFAGFRCRRAAQHVRSDNCQAAVGYRTEEVLPERLPGFVFYKFFFTPKLSAHRGRRTELSSSSVVFRDIAAQQLDEWSMSTSGRKEKVTSRFMLEGLDSSLSRLMCFFISHLDMKCDGAT